MRKAFAPSETLNFMRKQFKQAAIDCSDPEKVIMAAYVGLLEDHISKLHTACSFKLEDGTRIAYDDACVICKDHLGVRQDLDVGPY